MVGVRCSHTRIRLSRAYLWHLFRAHEMLVVAPMAEHNRRFTARLLGQVLEAVSAGRLAELRRELGSAAR